MMDSVGIILNFGMIIAHLVMCVLFFRCAIKTKSVFYLLIGICASIMSFVYAVFVQSALIKWPMTINIQPKILFGYIFIIAVATLDLMLYVCNIYHALQAQEYRVKNYFIKRTIFNFIGLAICTGGFALWHCFLGRL